MLEIRNLTVSFGGVKAIDSLSWFVPRGCLASVIGPNGAGKTTLFNTITGSVRPNQGDVLVDGKSIRGLRPDRIVKHRVARSFQHPRVLSKSSVYDNVALGAHLGTGGWLQNRHQGAQPARVRRALELVGLNDREEALAETLSYAELKKLDLARALATEPRLLLIDELFSGVSGDDRASLVGTLKSLATEDGLAIVMIEHHPDLVLALSDRVLVLNHGELVREGPPVEIAKSKEVERIYSLS